MTAEQSRREQVSTLDCVLFSRNVDDLPDELKGQFIRQNGSSCWPSDNCWRGK